MEPSKLDVSDYLAILKRRIWSFLIPVALIVAVAVPIILVLPPLYRSTATILIEDQAIPSELVKATVSTYAAERLEVITQRVMATQNLVDLINKLGLYRDQRNRETMTELADEMRKRFKMKLIEANVSKPASGGGKTTIAFTLTFEDRSAEKAQAAVNELVSLYIAENLRSRRQNAEETKAFLEQEVKRVADQISALETRLARFKEENAAVLPEQIKMVLTSLERAEQQVLTIQRRVEVLQERKIYLEANLLQIDPHLRSASASKDDLSPAERLRKLRSELMQLRARYGPGHPDVVRLVRHIAILSKEVGDDGKRTQDTAEIKRELASAKGELANAQRKYSSAHPDVIKLEKRIALLEKTLRDAAAAPEKQAPETGKYNPAYLQVKAEIAAADAEIKSLKDQEKAVRKQAEALQAQASRAPQVEREYGILQRNLEGAIATHRDLSAKLRQARLGEQLELDRKSERFSLIEPPKRASEPSSPNRPAYIMVAVVLAITTGAATAFGFETADRSIHSPRQLTALAGAAPLVVIPNLISPASLQRRRIRRYILSGSIVVLLIAGAYLFFVQEVLGPVDILRARFENMLERWLGRIM